MRYQVRPGLEDARVEFDRAREEMGADVLMNSSTDVRNARIFTSA